MHYKDLREFIALVEKVNLLRHVHGAQTHLEIGGVTEVAAGLPDCPALLFDDIPGFPRGFRIFTNPVNTPQRAALALGIDPKFRELPLRLALELERRNDRDEVGVTAALTETVQCTLDLARASTDSSE